VIQGLNLHGNAAYTDATLRADLPAGGGSVGFAGDRLPSTPKWAGMVGADYSIPIGGAWSAELGADWRYVGKREGYFPNAAGQPRYVLPHYDVIDLRAGVRRGAWSIMAYVKNVGDKDGQVAAYQLGPSTRVSVIRPRTYGLTLASNF
jgi:outer membrane receptor protein involved in Fe transport